MSAAANADRRSDPERRRRYSSERRRRQAEQTRDLMLEAADELFVERGYEGTSIVAVAERAGISPESVYGHFGTKRALLGDVMRRAVRGGDGPPVPEQEAPRRLAAVTDQSEQLRLFAADIVQRLERAAPLMTVVGAAARSDPEVAALYARLHADRRRNLGVLVDALAGNGPLRLRADAALDTVWALTSPELHQLLRRERAWSSRRYRDWLASSLAQLLLP